MVPQNIEYFTQMLKCFFFSADNYSISALINLYLHGFNSYT